MRIGLGYDIHPLAAGRRLLVGGIEIPFEKGAIGHSDGDCLYHALTDALLGAAGLGDIGHYFPDTDPRWRDVSSSIFLKEVRKLLWEHRLCIENIDANIQLEKPTLRPHLPGMIQNIGELLGIERKRINIKAKRGEGIDAIGRGEAIAAQVAVLLNENKKQNVECP